jgi:excisionase family DNA binding protein
MLKLTQVALRLNTSLSNVYALIESGKLSFIRAGANGKGYRVTEEDLQLFIDQAKKGRRAPALRRKENPRPFRNLNADRLRQAWRRQGVDPFQTGADSLP